VEAYIQFIASHSNKLVVKRYWYTLDDMQENIRIPSTKGTLAAAVHRPQKKTDRLAILCPGYLDTKDYEGLARLAEALAGQGFTAVRFDPTGTWESEGTIADYTTTQYLADVKSVLDYMLREGNYTYVLLGGHSRGGMVSILYTARDSRISAVVGIMPSSPRTFPAQKKELWKKEGVALSERDIPGKRGKREYRVPYSHAEDRDKYDVIEEVKKVHVPILFLTGDQDTNVLPEHVELIFDNANEPKKFITFKGIGHDYRHNPEEVERVNERILTEVRAFIKR